MGTVMSRLYESCPVAAVLSLLRAVYTMRAMHSIHCTSGKTYLPCQVALCQNTLDKALMTYGGKNMLGKRLNCHSVHVMVDDYYTRHVNIDQPKKWHFWPKEPSAWSLFPAFHTGFGA